MERVFLRFMLGSLAALVVVVGGGFLALRQIAIDEAEHDTRERVEAAGRVVEAAGLSDGVLTGDRAALRRLDDLVLGQVLTGSVVRVKLWTKDGSVLYSDVPQLIGRRFVLGADERELFEHGGSEAELSDLSRPENRYERPEGKLLEAHTTIRTPNGTQVLFEIYQRFSSISADRSRLLRAFAPALLGGLVVLLLFQLPFAWSLQRRLQRDHREREALLSSAIEASARERGQIAADLHDGVVQDLAGVAFGLAPLAAEARARGDADDADVLDDATARLRQGVRDLRTLLVEIHPPNLDAAGLEVALSDLLSPFAAAGLTTSLDVEEEAASPGAEPAALLYRTAREAVRNALQHGAPRRVEIALTRPANGRVRLRVSDDGSGFDAQTRERSAAAGHVGLTLLEGLAERAGGRLDVRSAPGAGTAVELELPT
ncbi:ATP-binding protein [Conexibacter sp. JD483]|uniref:sensor histidine kinase n=1 Tax=unclassified Conexibacter TaxID=2627773 RepID=UPI002722EC9F|nr:MULTISPECIES: ATP-binding protein [unclassified Conexibacter]MDO8186971.1 histidine kinase [Conexibacter sp. CPCC 205706]MDO8200574.1 histidine kinase [Conexibacter sp. CPCC 205762]MDR9368848.1 ATP-binding protein [Conexibacter sp. JD483]